VTQPLYLSYFADRDGGTRWGISIHLEDGGFGRPAHDRLRDLHAAADAWRGDFPNVFLRSDLGVEPEPRCRRTSLSAYLYSSGAVNGARLGRHLTMLHETGSVHRYTVRPGAPVEGADLVGRGERTADLLRITSTGSCHLRAPRRYGKTSLLRHLAKILSAAGRPCLFADISSGHTAVWFLVTVARGAMESSACRPMVESLPELTRWPEPAASPIEKSRAFAQLRERIDPNPWSFGKRLLEALGQAEAVLLLDEFSVFLREANARNREEARDLADLLASSRRSGAPARQVLAGSAGLTSYLRFHELEGSFSDLSPLDLPPLAETEAALLVEELLYGENQTPSPEVVARILKVVGEPVPYFLHMLVNAVLEETVSGAPVTVDEVDRAYNERVLGTSGNELFKSYSLQGRPYPGDLRTAASRLLAELARRPEGATGDQLEKIFARHAPSDFQDGFGSLLSCLEEDYDLVERDGRWLMRCKVLRDRWALREPWLTRVE
jgi:uncharacterized protein